MAGRREFLKELGYQPFRASQLSKHYFERLVNDPAQMTDLPAQDRDEIVSRANAAAANSRANPRS